MLPNLRLWNFSHSARYEGEVESHAFILRTCQRTLVLSFDQSPFLSLHLPPHELVTGEKAYLFLLETICGLKSKLIGENEIVGQFKEAYQLYLSQTLKDTRLVLILEKLFKDAKDIRTKYLIGISQKTYASLTRKHLVQKSRAQEVVVVGSGSLAEDLINQLKKKARVILCARNSERVQYLKELHDLPVIPWEERESLKNKPFLANTIGADSIIFDEAFFKDWSHLSQRLFVDLGSPSSIKTSLTLTDGVVRLDDIFKEGAILEGHKEKQITLARLAMRELVQKRQEFFEQKFERSSAPVTPQNVLSVRYL